MKPGFSMTGRNQGKNAMLNAASRNLPSLAAKTSLPEKKLKYIVGLHQTTSSTPQAAGIKSPASELSEEYSTIESPLKRQDSSYKSKGFRLNKLTNSRGFQSQDFRNVKKNTFFQDDDVDDSQEYKSHLTTPMMVERVVSDDEGPQNLTGKEAVSTFYLHYKKLGKIKDVNNFTQVQNATYTCFLDRSENLQLLPSKLGFVKEKGDSDNIKLNHYRLGDRYAEVLSEGMRSSKGFSRIELSNNRLTQTGANHLLSKINHLTKFLNLSNNNIGKIGCEHVCSILNLKNSKLLELNLESNKLGDSSVNQLCEAIAYNNSLRKLNLGRNFVSDKSTEKLKKLLEFNSSLEEIYLHWNQIKSAGGVLIVEGLKSAAGLKVLDLSWNSLGLNGNNFAKAFASYIATNTTLIHLDLSNNCINKDDAKVIAEDLRSNHTLFGLHFHGNAGYIDCKGFLVVLDDWNSDLSGRANQPAIDGAKFQAESLNHHIGNWGEYRDICWICEGWKPYEICWTPGESGLFDQDPIYVHISYEGYKGVYLPSKKEFKSLRMVPPRKFEYFFTVEDGQTQALDLPYKKPENLIVKIKINNDEKEIRLDCVNYVGKGAPGKLFDEDFELYSQLKELQIMPRIPDDIYVPAETVYERAPWKFPISIFRNYRVEAEAVTEECFKVDFEKTRISKLVKDDQELTQVHDILLKNYAQLKDCYKYYAAIGAPSDIWSIPLNTFTEFCNVSGIIDGKNLKLADFDRIFIATFTKTEKEKNHRNPDRALVRYQFLEGLVRLAEQKYFGNGLADNHASSLKMLMNENVCPIISKFDHHKWRVERYWNEEVDTIYKSYLPILKGVYKKYSGERTLPGQKNFMCLEEFNRLMVDGELFTDHYGERDAVIAFSLAMMTQVDELHSDRIYQMSFVEFLEALARATEKIAPSTYNPHLHQSKDNTNSRFDPSHKSARRETKKLTGKVVLTSEDLKDAVSARTENNQSARQDGSLSAKLENELPYEQRAAQPLHVKLEGMIPLLYSLCGLEVKEIWTLPETSIFEMEEVKGKQRFPTKKKKIMRINPTHATSIEPYDGINALQI